MRGGEWEDIEVTIPAKGQLGILRLYLPAEKQAVEVDRVILTGKGGAPRRWEF